MHRCNYNVHMYNLCVIMKVNLLRLLPTVFAKIHFLTDKDPIGMIQLYIVTCAQVS